MHSALAWHHHHAGRYREPTAEERRKVRVRVHCDDFGNGLWSAGE